MFFPDFFEFKWNSTQHCYIFFGYFCRFAHKVEEACITTIEEGKMTKDLAICIYGAKNATPDKYLYTEDFLNAIDNKLKTFMK